MRKYIRRGEVQRWSSDVSGGRKMMRCSVTAHFVLNAHPVLRMIIQLNQSSFKDTAWSELTLLSLTNIHWRRLCLLVLSSSSLLVECSAMPALGSKRPFYTQLRTTPLKTKIWSTKWRHALIEHLCSIARPIGGRPYFSTNLATIRGTGKHLSGNELLHSIIQGKMSRC